MSEKPVISPDGRFVLVNGEWLELAQQNVSLTDSVISGDVSMSSTVNINTRSPSEEITNLAELAVVKLSNGDMAAAKEVYTEAKKIDVSIAMDTFENKYATKIGKGYTDIAESYAVEVARTPVTVSGQNFGSAGMLWDVDGNHRLSALRSQQNIAVSNALSFLGSPAGMNNLPESEISKISIAQITQLYRLGLICKSTGLMILKKTNEAFARVDGVTSKFIGELRGEAAEHADLGSGIIINVTLLDLKGGFNKIQEWKRKFSDLESSVEYNEDWHEDFQMKQKQYQQCFIATAAYGTPFAKDIDVLRMWRDNKLKSSVMGRSFVKTYYIVGPYFAWFISRSRFLKSMVRKLLTPVIYIAGKNNEEEIEAWRFRRANEKIRENEIFN